MRDTESFECYKTGTFIRKELDNEKKIWRLNYLSEERDLNNSIRWEIIHFRFAKLSPVNWLCQFEQGLE